MVWLLSENRVFLTTLSTVCLEVGTIDCTVLQEFILGPLLLLLYINNIPQTLSNAYTYRTQKHLLSTSGLYENQKCIKQKICKCMGLVCW